MAWYLAAPSHHLDPCWFIFKGVLWHSFEFNFTRSYHELNPSLVSGYCTWNYYHPLGQWLNERGLCIAYPMFARDKKHNRSILLVGLLKHFPHSAIFTFFLWLPIEYHVHIWQVSPQFSCGETWQMWAWWKDGTYIYVCIKSKLTTTKILTNGALVPPHRSTARRILYTSGFHPPPHVLIPILILRILVLFPIQDGASAVSGFCAGLCTPSTGTTSRLEEESAPADNP